MIENRHKGFNTNFKYMMAGPDDKKSGIRASKTKRKRNADNKRKNETSERKRGRENRRYIFRNKYGNKETQKTRVSKNIVNERKKIENERDTDRQRKRDPREIKRDN